MITQVSRANGFGVYSNFTWPAKTPDFRQYNLVFGWNYSGKTTFSRMLRCFELGERHADFPAATVELRGSDGQIHSIVSPQTAPQFRVFNSDFVRDNIEFEFGAAKAFVSLGAEDIAKKAQLAAAVTRLEYYEAVRKKQLAQEEELREALNTQLTERASQRIKHPLSKIGYDRRHLLPKVAALATSYHAEILEAEEAAGLTKAFYETDHKAVIEEELGTLTPYAELLTEANALLGQSMTDVWRLERLHDSKTEEWVRDGLALHAAGDGCAFCGQQIPQKAWDELCRHFSTEYQQFILRIDSLIKRVEAKMEQNISLPAMTAFHTELQHRWGPVDLEVKRVTGLRWQLLYDLRVELQKKRLDAFSGVCLPARNDIDVEVDLAKAQARHLIEAHNHLAADSISRQKSIFERLERHVAAECARDTQYHATVVRAQYLADMALQTERFCSGLREWIAKTSAELGDAARAIAEVNRHLKQFFPDDRLEIAALGEGHFELQRRGYAARNLSDGERTVVAFCYFVAKVLDGSLPLDQLCVFIDDPICSLDGNHTFNMYAAVRHYFEGCKQLFISTHNHDFFSLIKEWAGEGDKAACAKWSVYQLVRRKDGTANIVPIPKLLLDFKSEYHYLFWKVLRVRVCEAHDDEDLLSAPNIVRRFLETFGGIMIPEKSGLEKKSKEIFVNDVQRRRIVKFAHYYSHASGVMHAMAIPDLSECVEVAAIVVDAIKAWDSRYFGRLVTAIGDSDAELMQKLTAAGVV